MWNLIQMYKACSSSLSRKFEKKTKQFFFSSTQVKVDTVVWRERNHHSRTDKFLLSFLIK
jgi:hypothetical protein